MAGGIFRRNVLLNRLYLFGMRLPTSVHSRDSLRREAPAAFSIPSVLARRGGASPFLAARSVIIFSVPPIRFFRKGSGNFLSKMLMTGTATPLPWLIPIQLSGYWNALKLQGYRLEAVSTGKNFLWPWRSCRNISPLMKVLSSVIPCRNIIWTVYTSA